MKKEIPQPVVIGSLVAVLVLAIGVGLYFLRDQTPTKKVNMVGREKLTGTPPPSAPPAWVMQKFAAAKAGAGH